ncbi:MAG: hypothetical protein R6V85_10080 [Polyangia bacterium]
MRIWAPAFLSIAAALGCGCWGEVEDIYPDASALDTEDTGTQAGQPQLIEGGGAGGGSIDGSLAVFAVDEESGDPVAGARVMLARGEGDATTGESDDQGRADFEEQGLEGPLDLHVLADGYVLESAVGIDAAWVTLPLRPELGLTEHAQAMIAGELLGVDQLPEAAGTEHRTFIVGWGPPMESLLSVREPLRTGPAESSPIDIDQYGTSFGLQVRAEPGALYAIAGIVQTWGNDDPDDDVYDWRMAGVVTGLNPSPAATINGVEINLDIVLGTETHIDLGSPPAAYETAGVQLLADLGSEGTLWLEGRPTSNHELFPAPALDGPLEGGLPLAIGRCDQELTVEDGGWSPESMPAGRMYARDLESFIGWSEIDPYVLWPLPPPPAQLWWDGQKLSCLPHSGTDIGGFSVSDGEGLELWRVTVTGELPDELPFPDLPEQWGFDGIPQSGVTVRSWTAKMSADPNDWSYSEFAASISETTYTASAVE